MMSDGRLESVYRESVPLLGPETAWIDLTNRCNLRCITCWNRSPLLGDEAPDPRWQSQELPFDAVIRLVDELAEMGTKKLWFSGGGDPLLYRRLFDVIRHTTRKGLSSILTTSFATATEDTIREMVESGLDELSVSLWAASPRVYASLHPGAPDHLFGKITGLLKKLTGEHDRPALILGNIICSLNYREVGRMVSLGVELGARDVWFNTMDVASEKIRGLLLSREQIEELLAEIDVIRERLGGSIPDRQRNIIDFTDFREIISSSQAHRGFYHTDIIDSISCYAGWYMVRILANGDVCPCCKADRFPMGNILRGSFSEIWTSPGYQEFRVNAKRKSKFDPYFSRINCPKACDVYCLNKVYSRRYRGYLSDRGYSTPTGS